MPGPRRRWSGWGYEGESAELLLRRVRLGMWQPKLCLEIAPRLRSVVRRATGWGFPRWRQELALLKSAVASWLPLEGR